MVSVIAVLTPVYVNYAALVTENGVTYFFFTPGAEVIHNQYTVCGGSLDSTSQ